MRIEELRIGNCLLAKEDNKPCKVESIDKQFNYVWTVNDTTVYSYPLDLSLTGIEDTEKVGFSPVRLSEYDLLKCGFEETQLWEDNPTYYVLDNFVLKIDYSENVFYFDDTKIEYVHELQNIYFALTKTELKIEL